MKLTAPQTRALQILRDKPGIKPKHFAKLMWPDSVHWQRSVKCGPKGSHRGGGMYRAAGGFLGKLERAGLVKMHERRVFGEWQHDGYYLTEAGQAALGPQQA